MYLTYANRDSMEEDFLEQTKGRDLDLIVCSDAEAILGIGDQGVGVRSQAFVQRPSLLTPALLYRALEYASPTLSNYPEYSSISSDLDGQGRHLHVCGTEFFVDILVLIQLLGWSVAYTLRSPSA